MEADGVEIGLRTAWAGLSALERLVRGRGGDAPVRSVLVLEYMLPLGCCVHLTPVFEAIRVALPEVLLTVATRKLGAEVLRHHPAIDHLIETPDPLVDLWGSAIHLRGRMKQLGIEADCALTGASDRRTRLALLAILSGARWRGGYTVHSELYQRSLEYDETLSLIGNNLRLASLLGCGGEHREPAVFYNADAMEMAQGLARGVNPDGRPLLILVTQTSGGQNTKWHDGRFAEVARAVSDDFAVAYVGTAAEAEAIEHIRGLSGVGVSLAGKTGIGELAALLAGADAVISVDTGTMHVGRSTRVPMVVMGPSWQSPLEWMPLGLPQVRVLRGQDRKDIPEAYRLDEVSVPDVVRALEQMMNAFPPSAAMRDRRLRAGLSMVDHRAARKALSGERGGRGR